MSESNYAHDVRAKDAERQALQRQLDEWAAKGGIPQLLPTTPEKTK